MAYLTSITVIQMAVAHSKKGHPRKKTSFFSVQKFGIANKQPGESHKHYILGSSHNDPHQLYKISLIRCHLFPIHFPQSPATEISSPSPGTRTETTTTGITSSAMTFWRKGLEEGPGLTPCDGPGHPGPQKLRRCHLDPWNMPKTPILRQYLDV